MLSGTPALVVGGIDGFLRLFESEPTAKPVPWVERKGYFRGIKLPGFSDGLLTS